MRVREAAFSDIPAMTETMVQSFRSAFSGFVSPETMAANTREENCLQLLQHCYNSGTMHKSEVKSLLEVREQLECLCAKLVIDNASDDELASLDAILDSLRDAPDVDSAADAVFRFYHELAILSGNVLLPLMYYSFRSPGIYLWTLYCKRNGIDAMYRLKLGFYRALLNRNRDEAVERIHHIMQDAIDNLSVYGA